MEEGSGETQNQRVGLNHPGGQRGGHGVLSLSRSISRLRGSLTERDEGLLDPWFGEPLNGATSARLSWVKSLVRRTPRFTVTHRFY